MTTRALLLALLLAAPACAADSAALARSAPPLRPISGAPAVPSLSPEDARALANVDWAAVREEASALLSKFIQAHSVSAAEAPAADFFEKAARDLGLAAERFDGPGTWNVYVGTRLDAAPRLLLLSHLDTVPASDESWTYPPFSGTRAQGQIWGRGAADAKGQAIAHLMALAIVKRIAPDYPAPLAAICVSDEEVGGSGAAYVLKNHGARFGSAPVIGEGGAGVRGLPILPAEVPIFATATAEKSSLWVKLTLEIQASGHGSVPPVEYANRQMVMALNRLVTARMPMRLVPASRMLLENLARYYDFPKNFFLNHPDWPLVKKVLDDQLSKEPLTSAIVRDTATLIGLETEAGASNAIPRKIVAKLDCRLLPGTDETEFLGRLAGMLEEPRIKLEVFKRSPASAGTAPGLVFAALEGAVHADTKNALVSPMVFPASSDGNAFRNAGHDFYGLFPCTLDRSVMEAIHGVDERLSEDALLQATRILAETMLRLRGARTTK